LKLLRLINFYKIINIFLIKKIINTIFYIITTIKIIKIFS
jgi:hypothetical protein